MSTLEWSSSGVGILSIVIAILIYLAFRKKVFGVLDPMTYFLITRMAPLAAVIVLMLSPQADTNSFFWLMVVSALIFIGTLWMSTSHIKPQPVLCDDGILRELFQAAVGVILLKLFLLLTSSGTLPIFGQSGSNSYIDFDMENKFASSLLLAIHSSEVILLSFMIPLTRGKTQFTLILLLVLALLLALADGKKSSLLTLLISIALGEYLRINFIQQQHRYFLKPTVLLSFCIGVFGWAGWIYSRTGGDISRFGLDSGLLLDLIYLQWAYPFFLFASGELSSFFDIYEVNRLIYFFHTILSPLGFPAFSASIGPALHEFQTGGLTGNGINPTFILEGYVLFEIFMPFYAAALAFSIGRIRNYLLLRTSLRKKVLYSALFLPTIYVAPVDALLFMKMIYGLILLLPLMYFFMWITKAWQVR